MLVGGYIIKAISTSVAVMLSLSKHLKAYLSGSFDRLRMTNLYYDTTS
jgi:hypothetical protein